MSDVKNILVISGSGRKKGDGYHMTESLRKEFGDDTNYNWTYLYLNDYDIKGCIGCRVCNKANEEKCLFKDDLLSIVSKINEAEGLVFTSPVYSMAVSSQLKAFIDRSNYLLHRPSLVGIPSVIISTTELSGTKSIIRYLGHILSSMALRYEGGIGVRIGAYNNNASYKKKTDYKIKKLAHVFKSSLKAGNRQKPSFRQVMLFNVWQTRALISKDKSPYDYNYWKTNGWLDTDYFYPTRISLWPKLVIILLKKRMVKFMREGFIYK